MSEQSNQNTNTLKNAVIGATKGLFSSIPIIGSIIIGAYDGCLSSRHADFIEQLSNRINSLQNEKIDMEYLKSEDFQDLLMKGYNLRMEHRSKLKAKFIYGTLIESLCKDRDHRFSTSLKESFLAILDQLTDEELEFLSEFVEGQYREKSENDIYQMGLRNGIAIDGLLAKRILKPQDSWNQHIQLTIFGREFIAYIKLLAQQDNVNGANTKEK